MTKREIVKMIRGQRAIDGAGVRLVRVLGHDDVEDFDPFLMLDSFDSNDPADYIAGFPMHPHRGIETITYLISGKIDHEDSLGNKDSILAGESQWMTAGSGIMHQEMPKEDGRMLGFQLWLNMSAAEKMAEPAYLSITKDMIPIIEREKATVRVLSGSFGGKSGVKPKHIPASIFDIELEKGASIDIPTNPDEKVFVFLLEGDGFINGQEIPEKTAVLFSQGDYITVAAGGDSPLRFMTYSAKPLGEPIAWGGPIVMNTRQELQHAFDELKKGTFIKHR
jgi:redox-sensitive bicupin YhaK (pirin superfamily)